MTGIFRPAEGEISMVTVVLTRELEQAAVEEAKKAGQTPQDLVLGILRGQLLPPAEPSPATPDEWERSLVGAAVDCGLSLSDKAVSSDALYE